MSIYGLLLLLPLLLLHSGLPQPSAHDDSGRVEHLLHSRPTLGPLVPGSVPCIVRAARIQGACGVPVRMHYGMHAMRMQCAYNDVCMQCTCNDRTVLLIEPMTVHETALDRIAPPAPYHNDATFELRGVRRDRRHHVLLLVETARGADEAGALLASDLTDGELGRQVALENGDVPRRLDLGG